MMKQLLLISLLFILFLFPLSASAQLYTGGSVGLSFMSNRTYFEASPVVGYRMNDMRVGVGGILSHVRRSGESWTHYGGRVFSQYDLFEGFFVHGEVEALNVEYSSSGSSNSREWILSVPVGAGYSQRVSGKMYATAMVLYDLVQDDRSPYANPIVRGGIRYHL